MSSVVTPTGDDSHVVTSPYNCALATSHLCQYSDCVFPIENTSLQNFVHGVEKGTSGAFDQMNGVVANFLMDLTAGSRFHGKMNVDLLEIKTNLIPFPNHKFLVSGISPIIASKAPRNINGFFQESMSAKATLCDIDPLKGTILSSALLIRGNIALSTVRSNIDKLAKHINFLPWNKDGWKIGICNNPPLYSDISINCLTNTSSICKIFDVMIERFDRLFKSKAYLQHYTEHMSLEEMKAVKETILFMKDEYQEMETPIQVPDRPKIIV